MSGYHLIVIGIILLLTPAVIALRDCWETWTGDEDDPDFENWFFSRTYQQLVTYHMMVVAGIWLIGTGALYLTLPV